MDLLMYWFIFKRSWFITTYLLQGQTQRPQHLLSSVKVFSASLMSLFIWSMPSSMRFSCSKNKLWCVTFTDVQWKCYCYPAVSCNLHSTNHLPVNISTRKTLMERILDLTVGLVHQWHVRVGQKPLLQPDQSPALLAFSHDLDESQAGLTKATRM